MSANDLALVQLTAARRALAEATTIQDKKHLVDMSAAAEVYARRQGASGELQTEIHAFHIDTLRLLGEAMKETPRRTGEHSTGGGSSGSKRVPLPDAPPTLADLGVSKKTSSLVQKLAGLPPEQFEQVKAGTASIAQAIHEVTRTKYPRQAPSVPNGKFSVIVADPPWDMQKIEREVRPNQVGFDYPTMTEEDLKQISLPAADDCHLFCWTTHKHLPSALRIIETWGFHYVLTMVWHKAGGFQPVGLPQYNCEFILYARSGTPKFIDTKQFFACFEAPRREHSRKPDAFYDLVRRVTDGRRIDMFSREKREGFEQYGNEIDKFVAAA